MNVLLINYNICHIIIIAAVVLLKAFIAQIKSNKGRINKIVFGFYNVYYDFSANLLLQ